MLMMNFFISKIKFKLAWQQPFGHGYHWQHGQPWACERLGKSRRQKHGQEQPIRKVTKRIINILFYPRKQKFFPSFFLLRDNISHFYVPFIIAIYLAQVSTVTVLGNQVSNRLGSTTARLGNDGLVKGLDGSVGLLDNLGSDLDTTTSTTDVNGL